MRRLVVSIITTVAVLGAAVPAQAAFKTGVADNDPKVFLDPLYQQLKTRITRTVVPIDTIAKGGNDLAQLDAFLLGAQATGTEVLITFNPTRDHTKRFNTTRDLPSPKQYAKYFKQYLQRYPRQKLYSPWNEINHPSQPTYKDPRKPAEFSNIARKLCKKCKIVAGDFIQQGGLDKYFAKFKKALKFKPTLWGFHNYPDTNRFTTKGTKEFLSLTRTGEVWLTETGGIVQLCPKNCSFEYDEARAARALKQMFKLAKSNRRIKRLYIYNFYGVPRSARFDAGLIGPDGKPREGYNVVKGQLGR